MDTSAHWSWNGKDIFDLLGEPSSFLEQEGAFIAAAFLPWPLGLNMGTLPVK